MCRFQVEVLFKWFITFGGLFFMAAKCNSLISSKKIRDPFNLPLQASNKNNELFLIKLLGVVRSGDRYGAVLNFDGKIETVFQNDNFFGFKVLAIKSDYVELIRGRTKKRLFIE